MIHNQPLQEGKILIGGSYSKALWLCRDYCAAHGWCVSVKQIQIIWTESTISGVEVYFFNYPRAGERDIKTLGMGLLVYLVAGLGQSSGSMVVNGEAITYEVSGSDPSL